MVGSIEQFVVLLKDAAFCARDWATKVSLVDVPAVGVVCVSSTVNASGQAQVRSHISELDATSKASSFSLLCRGHDGGAVWRSETLLSFARSGSCFRILVT